MLYLMLLMIMTFLLQFKTWLKTNIYVCVFLVTLIAV